MSRQQANRSRGEKGTSRAGGGAQSVPVPAVTTDVVPGRVTVAEWSKICGVDDDDEFIGSLVEEIVESTLEKCYDKYIARQVCIITSIFFVVIFHIIHAHHLYCIDPYTVT